MSDFVTFTDATFAQNISAMKNGVVLVHKESCPHCKNMMKVMERFSATEPQVTLALVDSEESPAAKEALHAERVPTIAIVKNGEVKQWKGGLMNPRELAALHASA